MLERFDVEKFTAKSEMLVERERLLAAIALQSVREGRSSRADAEPPTPVDPQLAAVVFESTHAPIIDDNLSGALMGSPVGY